MKLSLDTNIYAISRLPASTAIPPWGLKGSFFSICGTSDELSIVCLQENVPPEVKSEKGWRL